jgi:hypothetical protein
MIHISKQMTVKGVQTRVYEYITNYLEKLGYEIVQKNEPFIVISRKKGQYLLNNASYELWLTIALAGESFVNVFLDYQLRKANEAKKSNNGHVMISNSNEILSEIEKQYEYLWTLLTKYYTD